MGFLSGSAICLVTGAALSYLNPLEGGAPSPQSSTAVDIAAPSAPSLNPNAPATSTQAQTKQEDETQPAVATPLSPVIDIPKTNVETPKPEEKVELLDTPESSNPAPDRDRAEVNTDKDTPKDEVQVAASTVTTPLPQQNGAPQLSSNGDQPQSEKPSDLVVLETAPSQDLTRIEPAPQQQNDVPNVAGAENSAPQSPKSETVDVKPATSPKVAAATPDPSVQKPESSATATSSTPKVTAPKVKKSSNVDRMKVALPKAPNAPKADAATVLSTAPKPDPVLPNQPNPRAQAKPVIKQVPAPSPQVADVPDTGPATAEPGSESAETETPKTENDTGSQIVLLAPSETETAPKPQINEITPDPTPDNSSTTRPQTETSPTKPELPDNQTQVAIAPKPESKPIPVIKPAEPVAPETETSASITVPDRPDEATPAPVAVSPNTPDAPEFSGRAFDAFAVDFPPNYIKPYLTVILKHVEEGSVAMYDLLNFGAPITFGVDPIDIRSRWRENEFRKAGFEVVAMVPLGEEANLSAEMDAADIPLRIGAYFEEVPGAVAIVDSVDSDLYRSSRVVASVAEQLNLTGRGLVVHERFGVNRAIEAAQSGGIPSATMIQIIDTNRDPESIRRALDKSALQASKTGYAIVIGHTYPETMAAILPWMLGNTAKSVRLAPLTATMKRMERDNR